MAYYLVVLEDLTGEIMGKVSDNGRLQTLLPPRDDASYACLRFLDRYGHTIFNNLQMTALIDELQRLKEKSTDPADEMLLDVISDLASQCRDGVHVILRFVRD